MEKPTEGVSDMVYAIELLVGAIDRSLDEEESDLLRETLTTLRFRRSLNLNERRILTEFLKKIHPSNQTAVTLPD